MMDFIKDWNNNSKYIEMIRLMGQLSNLFSNSKIPYIHYRVTENVFCKYFEAENLARTDTAYDAKINNIGIGIKTFQLKKGRSTEKVAEFNALSHELRKLKGEELAKQLAIYRNTRINTANQLYDISQALYHIIGRTEGQLELFNTSYELVNLEKIKVEKDDDTSLWFHDESNEYVYNKSKSVLLKNFIVPEAKQIIEVSIISDPYELLEQLLSNKVSASEQVSRPYVVLPLYSMKGRRGNKIKYIYDKSGLNQWNANGRTRCENEVYIPIPKEIHNKWPDFFPPREVPFDLYLPNGRKISAKVCQEGGKALMSNPNSDLGEWLLRKVLRKEPWKLVTYNDLMHAGFDSIVIFKNDTYSYSIDVSYSESYNYKDMDF